MLVLLRYLKYKLIDAPDPSHQIFQYASRVTLVALIGLIAAKTIPISQSGWILISAVFLVACFRGQTHSSQFLSLFCSALYLLAASFFMTYLAQFTWWFMIFLLIVVSVGYLFVPRNADLGIVIVLNILFTLFLDGYSGNITIAWHRFIATAIGSGLAFMGAYLFWPYRPRVLLKRLNHVIEQKNIFYLQWVFTDFICGNISSNRLDSLKSDIASHLQETWQILLCYPDPLQLKQLKDNMDLFGQIAVLSRLLFEPTQQNSLIRFFSFLDELRKDFLELTKEKYSGHYLNQLSHQRVLNRLKQLEQQSPDNQDIQSVCFVLEKLADLTSKGKSDETRAFA